MLRERPELNENWMAMSTGTIAHRMNSHVTVARKIGRRHGSSHHAALTAADRRSRLVACDRPTLAHVRLDARSTERR